MKIGNANKLIGRQEMKRSYVNKIVCILGTMTILGFGGNALAQWEMGCGHHGGMHHGPARHHHEHGRPGCGYWGNLSAEDIKKIEDERSAFFEATQDIRQAIYQKRLELGSELAKKEPDAARAANLQRELSDLKAQFDLMRLDHVLKMKKINPYFCRGFMGRKGKGCGMMGPRGYGGCPNCPYQGYGGGDRRGPAMMGPGMDPGMRGPGYELNRWQGWSGRDCPQQFDPRKGAFEEKDARAIVESYVKSTRNPNLEIGTIKDVGDAFEAEIVTKENSLVDRIRVDKKSGSMRSAY
jgi:hypothetical protein